MNLKDFSSIRVATRDGKTIPFDVARIRTAIANAYLKDAAGRPRSKAAQPMPAAVRQKVERFTEMVASEVMLRAAEGAVVGVKVIQDQVEVVLMRAGEHDIARDYVLYRERRAADRADHVHHPAGRNISADIDGETVALTRAFLLSRLTEAADGLAAAAIEPIVEQVLQEAYDGITGEQLDELLLLAARSLIERDPDYDRLTTRLFLTRIRREVMGEHASDAELGALYPFQLINGLKEGIAAGRLDPRLASFDLQRLGNALKPERDFKFRYLGLQTLYDRYFLQVDGHRIEMPQTFFMRVAMGLAVNEPHKDQWAVQFYEILSSFRFMCSTPTLFNAGAVVAQLSSCYVSTVPDDLEGIYETIKENALLQKFAGGIGNDWTNVRALGSHIRGTNGKSQGVIPFLKVVNDTAVAVNQGGRRKGAACCYLETWHLDIEEFLELRKNVGDERRRTHDMNTAHWIPDLFMKRVLENGHWTLFSPVDVPDLHEKYGRVFDAAYQRYETMADAGEIQHFKRIGAVELWRKMLSMLFETGHPWICFKDPCNVRSPQQHVGMVHGSNLCTEITLNTSESEIAVCNLGSVNLVQHLTWSEEHGGHCIDYRKLDDTVGIAMRLLDNVIDLNHYAVDKARHANLMNRPVGLGMMGLQDCLQVIGLPFGSSAAVGFSSEVTEKLCFFAYWSSTELAEERGPYPSFQGSLWNKGILPIDSIEMLRGERGGHLDVAVKPTLCWKSLRARIRTVGMRNSNCVALAPTATISNIVGVFPSIEPAYQNLYVKSNLSGEFTVVNEYLVEDLKKRDLWDDVMIADLKYYEGSVQAIDRIPPEVKRLYATAFEIDAKWLIEAAAQRQIWIDQAQSLNLFFKGISGKQLDDAYRLAWAKGLKTTYYLRASGASSAEKSTLPTARLNAVAANSAQPSLCRLDDPTCESCQ